MTSPQPFLSLSRLTFRVGALYFMADIDDPNFPETRTILFLRGTEKPQYVDETRDEIEAQLGALKLLHYVEEMNDVDA